MVPRKDRQVVDEAKPRSFTAPEHADQLLDAIRWQMDTRYRVFKANPSRSNWIKLQASLVAFQAVQTASTGVYRAQLVQLWSASGRDLDRFVASL